MRCVFFKSSTVRGVWWGHCPQLTERPTSLPSFARRGVRGLSHKACPGASPSLRVCRFEGVPGPGQCCNDADLLDHVVENTPPPLSFYWL